MNKLSCFLIAFIFVGMNAFAQDDTEQNTNENPNTESQEKPSEKPVEGVGALRAADNGGYNPLSVRPIHLSDQMYRKTIWRAMDLREKQNKPLMAVDQEITRIMMDAVKAGKLTPYENDSLTTPMTIEEYNKKITIQGMDDGLSEEEKAMGFGEEEEDGFDNWGSEGDEEEETGPSSDFYFPNQLYQMEIKEDLIFDKHRSRMYNDIIAVSMKLPSEQSLKNIEEDICSFSYKDLVKVFREDPRATWYNPENDAMQHNLSEAFDLRLFSSYIIKVSNPNGDRLDDIYTRGADAGIRASQTTMWQLLEYEHNLWEF